MNETKTELLNIIIEKVNYLNTDIINNEDVSSKRYNEFLEEIRPLFSQLQLKVQQEINDDSE